MIWRPDLTGFHEFRDLRPHLSLGNCVEQQVWDKNLSGLIIPGIAAFATMRCTKTVGGANDLRRPWYVYCWLCYLWARIELPELWSSL